MNADEPTSRNRECVSEESFDYQTVAETLLRRELEECAFEIRGEFLSAAEKVRRGEELDHGDVAALHEELYQARLLVETITEAIDDDLPAEGGER